MEIGIVYASIFSFIVFIFNCIAILEVIESTRSICARLIWCVLIFLFPPFGVICYIFFSARHKFTRNFDEDKLVYI